MNEGVKMNRIKVTILLTILSTSMLAGCAQIDAIKDKITKNDESQ